MNPFLPLALLVVGQGHEAVNPIYRDLIQKGVVVGEATIPIPTPFMADGLDAEAQTAVITKVIGSDYTYDDFVRNSAVAPNILRMADVKVPKSAHPVKSLTAVFLAYGNLKTVASEGFFDKAGEGNRDGGEAKALTAADLMKRGIVIDKADSGREGYAYVVYPLIDKVEVRAVWRGYWSETTDSVVAASRLDPRFRGDAEFPNQWRPVTKKPGGDREYGDPQPYDGAAYYVKVTKLAQPAGALFVEVHVVFAEPEAWFGGANLLRSKLPPVVQTQVRSFRRELAKAKP